MAGMHYKIRYILAVATVFGTFPVSNITSPSTRVLRFRWFCWATLYSLFLQLGLLTVEVVSFDYTIQHLNQANLTVAGESHFKTKLCRPCSIYFTFM